MKTLDTLAICLSSLCATTVGAEPYSLSTGLPDAETHIDASTSPNLPTPEEWTGIRKAYEAARNSFSVTADGHVARSYGNAWLAQFDGRGFRLEPDSAGLSLIHI